MLMFDFRCDACAIESEELVSSATTIPACGQCGKPMHRIYNKSASLITAFIPMYPGNTKHMAGYTHTSKADQNATRIQSGYGGCVSPK